MINFFQRPIAEVHLKPGEIYCSPEKNLVKTLLGSCVAVCLWDEHLKLGGMNHVMLPLCREQDTPSTRYANVATFVLFDMMSALGARALNCHARLFGGACGMSAGALGGGLAVGSRNVEVCERVLRKLRIKVIGADTGGHVGRKIAFDQNTGVIRMNYLERYNFMSERIQVTRGEHRSEVW